MKNEGPSPSGTYNEGMRVSARRRARPYGNEPTQLGARRSVAAADSHSTWAVPLPTVGFSNVPECGPMSQPDSPFVSSNLLLDSLPTDDRKLVLNACTRTELIFGDTVLTVLDRPALETAACDCYSGLRETYRKYLGDRSPTPA